MSEVYVMNWQVCMMLTFHFLLARLASYLLGKTKESNFNKYQMSVNICTFLLQTEIQVADNGVILYDLFLTQS